MVLLLYADPISPPCRAIMAFLALAEIDYEYHFVNLQQGEHQTPAFLEINPYGQVPVIQHDDFTLTESNAILQYLADAFEVTDPWFPVERTARAKIVSFLTWSQENLRQFGSKWVVYEQLAKQKGRPAPREAIDECRERLPLVLQELEEKKENGEIGAVDEVLTLADLVGAMELSQVVCLLNYDINSYTSISFWYKDIVEKPEVAQLIKPLVELGKTLNPVILYADPISQPCRAVHAFLLIHGIPHEYKYVNLLKLEQKEKEFLDINPAGLVPATQHGAKTTGESMDILIYLCDKYDLRTWYCPVEESEQERIKEFVNWYPLALRKNIEDLFMHKVICPQLGLTVDEGIIAQAESALPEALQTVNQWLADSDYLAGSSPTIADLLCASELFQLRSVEYNLNAYPKIVMYILKLYMMPGFKKACEDFEGFMKSRK